MSPTDPPKQFFIQGITKSGKVFRPSDWADRLCGVMARFRPPGDQGDPRFTFSPYVFPEMMVDIRCVMVDSRLADIDVRAMDFVINFAKDNDLVVVEACSMDFK
ncbi:MAG: DUF3579 domain-containing protein [Betaproteobacteria bacterium]